MKSRQPIQIGTLTQFLDSLQSTSQDLVQHLNSGQKLCHYTSLEGAIGIIGASDIWLTNSKFSNDDEEQTYGYALVEETLAELKKTAPLPARQEWLERLSARLADAPKDEVYICCFCERDNLLSQWRGYAENGGGIGLEFDPGGFASWTGPDCQLGLLRLWKVFYVRAQQRQIIEDCINYPWPAADEAGQFQHIIDALQFFVPTFKKDDFSEEQERRLIFTPGPTVGGRKPTLRFRTRRGLLVPYYSLRELATLSGAGPQFRLPIKSMLIGPSTHRSLNAQSAKMMLSAYGYDDDLPVLESSTPYRG